MDPKPVMSNTMQSICILGSTGSIGTSTLDVVARNQAEYSVFALVAGSNWQLMAEQCIRFEPQFAVMQSETAAKELAQALAANSLKTQVLSGEQAACDMAAHPDVDVVMAAIVGAAGLLPTLAAVETGKKVLLANKEALVMSGEFFINKVKQYNATLLPIDSEHNAIFQAMPASLQQNPYAACLTSAGVSKILLTGSGGPFRETAIDALNSVTPEQAVAHPNWSMGQKISVDSATMMNKGLEFIEAKWLFNAAVDDIEVIIHPQSIIHSMVQYQDGSVLAQMGNPDMRTPIAHALAYPTRIDAGVKPLDFGNMIDFTFYKPDFARYPNLKLAIEACRLGQYATTSINAANEIAVAAFLKRQISFTDIYKVNAETLSQIDACSLSSLDDILAIDNRAREIARNLINKGLTQ